MPEPSQFNTGRTYPGRWTITFSNPPIFSLWALRALINGRGDQIIEVTKSNLLR